MLLSLNTLGAETFAAETFANITNFRPFRESLFCKIFQKSIFAKVYAREKSIISRSR